VTVECASCGASVVLKCEGMSRVDDYPIFSHFDCPHCRKQNTAKTPGHIISVEPV
jgi:transposase-like protein